MAVQLALKNKETGAVANLVDLDKEICEHLGVPVDDVKWCNYWMDTVGFTMALGGTREKLQGYGNQEVLETIWDFIESKYSNESYCTR